MLSYIMREIVHLIFFQKKVNESKYLFILNY